MHAFHIRIASGPPETVTAQCIAPYRLFDRSRDRTPASGGHVHRNIRHRKVIPSAGIIMRKGGNGSARCRTIMSGGNKDTGACTSLISPTAQRTQCMGKKIETPRSKTKEHSRWEKRALLGVFRGYVYIRMSMTGGSLLNFRTALMKSACTIASAFFRTANIPASRQIA
jgi:hypothetical protein